jgi:hypothetical protein
MAPTGSSPRSRSACTQEVVIVIIDSMLALVGNTRIVPLDTGGAGEVLVKLEGDNPSGSVFDRLLTSAVFAGGRVQVRQHDQLAAAVALAAGSLELPLTLLTATPDSNAARLAATFGATVVPGALREPMCDGVELEPEKSLAALVEECAAARGPDRSLVVVLPPVEPFVACVTDGWAGTPAVLELLAGAVRMPLLAADPAARSRLARRGLLMDDLSAACAEWAAGYAARHPDTTVVTVAACDGAITPHLPSILDAETHADASAETGTGADPGTSADPGSR